MLVEKLIEKLEKLPKGTNVCIFDHLKNLDADSGFGDGSTEGIHFDFEVAMLTKKDVAKGVKPFATLSFENDDYKIDID